MSRMLSHFRPEDGGTERHPALTMADFQGADRAVVTVVDAQEIRFPDRVQVMVRYHEFPERVHWLNVSQTGNMVNRYGADLDDWIGKRVPLVRTLATNPRNGESAYKPYVAPAHEWDSLLRAFDAPKPRKRAAARKSRKS